MFHRIREPFGKAGLIVAVIALVAALVGGAYAAETLTGKEKKEVKKIAKKYAGQDGKPGAQGPVGPPGAKGDPGAAGAAGKDGTNGTNGTNGKSVTVTELDPGNGEGCEDTGGAKFQVGAEPAAFACNGEDGTAGSYPATLPAGRTMSGFWEVLGDAATHLNVGFNAAVSTISFPLPLEAAPTETILIKVDSSDAEKTKCPGSATAPDATPGVLCLYPQGSGVTLKAANALTFGAVLLFEENDEAFGSWAVGAPTSTP